LSRPVARPPDRLEIHFFVVISVINKTNPQEYLNLSDFSLQPIKHVYSDFNKGKEVYFLDSNNQQVRIESIEKVPYKGRIYDVDVPNDVILVRKGNGIPVWSGNSNNQTNETQTACEGIGIEFDYIVDPTEVITEFTGSEVLVNVTQENNFSHLEISDNAPYNSLVLYHPFP